MRSEAQRAADKRYRERKAAEKAAARQEQQTTEQEPVKPQEDKRTKGQKRQAERARTYATVVYPESAPENWRDVLTEHHVAALISPLHDKDTNPDGKPKKPHYHVMLLFETPKDFGRQVKPIFDAIGGVGRENVASTRGYGRYLCHLDNPEKTQYRPEDVQALGGADYAAVTHLATDDRKILKELLMYVAANQIVSYAELLDLAMTNNEDWFSLLIGPQAYTVREYMKALNWELTSAYTRAHEREQEVYYFGTTEDNGGVAGAVQASTGTGGEDQAADGGANESGGGEAER